ncbi:Frag1/DRAM/Sfk1 family-domain-containing protein [Lentinula aff. detonsa]|uniref:Frag1/DRAM/Sfk1 family-domain-containing protein n=1 Tax=Lentinula aff. detonsa TaxID=2804958 RepID=A0AA38NN37_9AGAR|nr:Frag1/DRAM/Sfk1 family-domain-containing protein [Lentinula aff. detonsa]
MSSKEKDGPNTGHLILKASTVARAHTILAYTAFISALTLGLLLHYKKIVKNGVAGYPEEWFPSVSATIGDWYPERNVFQILIALTSGPRLMLVSLLYYLQRSQESSLPAVVFISGIIRTLSCGGWVYITSSDDHDVHDVFMISYIVLNLPWMIGGIYSTSKRCPSVRKKRSIIASTFFLSIVPLVYFFVQHKVHRIPGAYTQYSFFEWGLIFLDVLYDACAEEEFRLNDLHVAIGDLKSVNGIATPTQVKYIHIGGSPSRQDRSISPKIRSHSVQDSRTSLTNMLSCYRPYVSFTSDIYLSYIFWSVFTSLIPTLFYFSVWELAIAGSELALFSTLSPIWLSIPPVLNWVRTRSGQATMHLLSFIGVGAYIFQSPLHRLFLVAFATSAAMIPQVVTWADNPAYQSIITALGLMLSSLSKHVNHSNNPVWPFIDERSGGYNKEGLLLAILALYEFFTRPDEGARPFDSEKNDCPESEPTTHWILGALPLGSFIFILHSLLADPSTLIAWSWTGYENGRPRGPLPHLHGSLTLLCQSFGLLIAIQAMKSSKVHLLANPLWFAFGSASSYVMYTYRNWPGYLGGLGLSIFIMGSFPLVLHNASSTRAVFKTSFTAMLVYCLLALANVWTVAYAFVPGGVYLRERTDLVTIAQMACLALAFRWPALGNRSVGASSLSSTVFSCARTILTLISVLGVLATLYRLPITPAQPFRPGHRMLRAGIWTIHFGIDNEGRDSQRRVMNLIRDMELDVVGLLETDLHRNVYGNRDLTRVIIEEMGYNVDLGPGPNSHTWGAVLLSKFPIINSTHHLLPSPHGELAPAIEAVLDMYGTAVTVVVSHNGQEEDPLDRELQSRELARIMSTAYPRPVVFLGYVVTRPHALRPNPYEILVKDGNVHDVDQDDGDRWCEYILYRGLYRTAYARVSRSTVTDTELQVAQFVLPRHGVGVTNDTEAARYLRSRKEELPPEHWFPMSYYGNQRWGGVNGHFYHVFNTPLYYAISDDAEI